MHNFKRMQNAECIIKNAKSTFIKHNYFENRIINNLELILYEVTNTKFCATSFRVI